MLAYLQRFSSYKQKNPNELTPKQFISLEHEIKYPDSTTISDEYLDFKLWCRNLPSRQESFANYLQRKLPKYEGAKILEIGCGRTARLSRLLSEKGFNMTCIDPNVEPQGNNIEYIQSKFEYTKFDLSPYSFVIAQEPCDATEHIVRACINQNTPFIMSLCGVPHKLISGKMPKDINEWYKYLQNISYEQIRLFYVSLDPISTTAILKNKI